MRPCRDRLDRLTHFALLALAAGLLLPGCERAAGTVCTANDAPSLSVGVTIDGTPVHEAMSGVAITGDATVVAVDSALGTVTLQLVDAPTELGLTLGLPANVTVPVAVGERVVVDLEVEGPWWINQWVELRGAGGELRLRQYEGEFEGDAADAHCRAEETFCGAVVYVPLSFGIDEPELDPADREVTLQPGERRVLPAGDDTLVVQLGAPRIYTRFDCTDISETWVTWSIVRQ